MNELPAAANSAKEFNTEAYWNKVYEKEISLGIDNRSDPLGWDLYMSVIKRGDRILDFGCGRCEFLQYICEHMLIDAYGVDHSSVALEYAYKKNHNLKLIDDIDKWPEWLKAPVFDVITFIHSAEHFEQPEIIIRKLMGYLKPGGVFVFTLPIDDMEWHEHFKIWKIEDAVDFVADINCWSKIIYRKEVVVLPPYRGYKVPTKIGHPDGTAIKHAVVFLKKE